MTHNAIFRVRFRHTEPIERLNPWITPGADYFVTPSLLRKIREQERLLQERVVESIRRDTSIPLWQGESLDGLRVGILPSGAMGDHLVATAAVAELWQRYPTARLTVYAEDANVDCWRHNRAIATTQARRFRIAISEAEMQSRDVWIIPRHLSWLRRGTPENIYTLLESAWGVDIEIKTPYVMTTAEERDEIPKLFKTKSEALLTAGNLMSLPFALIQLTTSERARTPGDWFTRLHVIADALPEHWLCVIGKKEAVPFEQTPLGPLPIDRIVTAYPPNPRIVFSLADEKNSGLPFYALAELARRADLVVTPDSLGCHLAAAFHTPCLALFNDQGKTTDRIPPPSARIATYSACEAISMHGTPMDFADTVLRVINY